jgi:putative transcriptional regulator
MQHTDFEIGLEFECGGQRWRCTDLGTRTVIAIPLEYPDNPSWYKGPPYAIAESVFDEYDIKACKPVEDNPEVCRAEKDIPNTREKFAQGKSEAFAAIHETMDALHQIEAIDKKTMRDFDAACLADLPDMEPEEIRALRERERGVRRPGGAALRLLSIVEKRGLDSLT